MVQPAFHGAADRPTRQIWRSCIPCRGKLEGWRQSADRLNLECQCLVSSVLAPEQ